MPKTGRDITIKLDNTGGTLTEITAYCNQASLEHAMALITKEYFGNKRGDYLNGKADVTLPLNGMVNSTTEPIFGKLIGVSTSITKTVQFGNGLKLYYGEAWPTDVKFSGSPQDLQVWSATFTFSSGVTRTSVTQA